MWFRRVDLRAWAGVMFREYRGQRIIIVFKGVFVYFLGWIVFSGRNG